ncbi:hypothetical protein HYV89_03625 [Candidatus Woesearchaeota archaeon]|nr:hypothetical protein [Candidatus Woesearchaeota archaeon]
MIQLGERIQLNNFEELQPGELTILKKMIGNHANKFHDFKKLHITLKAVHKKEKSQKYQVNAMLEIGKKMFESESTHFNLFFTINEVLERLKKQFDETKD